MAVSDIPRAGAQTPDTARRKAGSKHKSTRNVFWRLMMQVCIVGGFTHGVFGVLFYTLDATLLAWANVGSVSLFAVSYACIRMRYNWIAVALVFTELFGHAALAVRTIGWDSGFHYYLMLVAPIVVMSNLQHTRSKLLMVAGVCIFYMVLDIAMRMVPPIYVLNAEVINALRYFNIVVSFVLLTYLAFLYLGMIKRAEQKLLVAASTDPLTSLYNRRRLMEIIDYEIKRSKRQPRTLCFLLGDIDHFKAINDRYGHDGGDQVLVNLSQVLRNSVREQDSVGRWGGEEFLVVLPNTEMDGAQIVASRIIDALAGLQVMIAGQPVPVTMTLGLASCREGEPVEAAIARADEALYRGKTEGRNRLMLEQR